MTVFRLLLRSLLYHRRSHAGVVLGLALASALLAGALAVGDSVRHTLHLQALARLGRTTQAVIAPEHFFRAELAGSLTAAAACHAAPALLLNGVASRPDETARANDIQVVGADEAFWRIGDSSDPLAAAGGDEAVMNDRLARHLRLTTGDVAVVRVELPSPVSRDIPLSGRSDQTVSLRLRVRAILPDDGFGRFGLAAGQVPPMNVFVRLDALQQQLKRNGRANLLLSDATNDVTPGLSAAWTLADAGVEIRPLRGGREVEVRSESIFISPGIEAAVRAAAPGAAGALTYFATDIACGTNHTPYSFVTATGDDLQDNSAAINRWLADDLAASTGDVITLRYFALGERRDLVETSAQFRVTRILDTEPAPDWMPPFPGMAEVEDCRRWEPGIPVDTVRIRPKDEAYWRDLRGTPKAFVSLAAGQQLWSNRFGRVTALRVPTPPDSRLFAQGLRDRLSLADAGLRVVPVREQALRAGGEAMDFGSLFLSLSFFLIVAALALASLLFTFQAEQRQTETGVLRALGFPVARLRRMALVETASLAFIGALLGLLPALVYTRLTLAALGSVWRDAVGGVSFHFHVTPVSIMAGLFATVLLSAPILWWTLRRQARKPVAELLARGRELEWSGPGLRWKTGTGVAVLALIGALGILLGGRHQTGMEAAGRFFGAGACLLIAGLGGVHALLARIARGARIVPSLGALALRTATRRPGRCMTSVGVLAAGVFLVVATGAFRQDPSRIAHDRRSGTGGFALFARSALPIHDNLDTPAGRAVYGLVGPSAEGVSVVALRVRAGDEASCLNLNRAQQPVLWGVDPAALARRDAFRFLQTDARWAILDRPLEPHVVPAIGDQQSVQWALGRKIGDELPFTDDQGRTFRVRIVATLADSILQGGLLISERHFVDRFPRQSGHRLFLIDVPQERAGEVASDWSRALADRGMEIVSATRRLSEFHAVANTYLLIFQVLGGLGVALGGLGFAIVALRNGFERRSELALLRAVGFTQRQLRALLWIEQAALAGLGWSIGLVAALVATLGVPGAGHLVITGLMAAGSVALMAVALALAIGMVLRTAQFAALRGE